MKYIILLTLLFSQFAFSQTSVSWKTTKTMFLFNKQTPVGINNSVTVESGLNSTRYIKLLIPIEKFSSGEPDRDAEVVKILKSDVQPNLIFETGIMNQSEFNRLKSGDTKTVNGNLTIANVKHPIKVQIEKTNNFLVGTVETKFSDFGIEPPSVAGGVVASVDDYLVLVGRVDLADLE